MAQKKERLYYLDYARGIGIVLMVFGHIMDENHLPVSWFYGIHIAMFFVLSGILMAYTQVDKRPLKKVIAGYARSLLLPCITYEVIFVAMYGILYHFDYNPLGHQPWDILKLRPVNTPMWFLITSFFAQLALVLLMKGYDALTKKKSDSEKGSLRLPVLLVCAVLYVLPFLFSAKHPNPGVLWWTCTAVGFLAYGYFGCRLYLRIRLPLPAALAMLAAGILLSYPNGPVTIYKLFYNNPFLYTASGVVGSAALLQLVRLLPEHKWFPPASHNASSEEKPSGRSFDLMLPLRWLGTNTAAVLGLHIIVLRIVETYLHVDTSVIPGCILATFLIFLFFIPICYVINRWFPWMAGKKKLSK